MVLTSNGADRLTLGDVRDQAVNGVTVDCSSICALAIHKSVPVCILIPSQPLLGVPSVVRVQVPYTNHLPKLPK